MKISLATSFQPDHDEESTVHAVNVRTGEPVAKVITRYGTGTHEVQLVNTAGLTSVSLMKIGLAAAELIDSMFTGNPADSRIEV